MPDTIDRLVRLGAEQHGDKPMVIDPEIADQLRRARRNHPRAGRARSSKPASARGRGSV